MKALLLTAVALVSTLAVTAASPADTQRRATVRLADRAPIIVRGKGFRAAERVRVVVRVTGGRTFAKTTVATRAGALVARFSGSIDNCAGFTIAAKGALDTTAKLREPPPPCGMVLAP
ncbi:MAG: hypothetical protein ABR583_12765 [Gaiellaceae bacterium]